MPAIAPLTLADGQATPVNHTFSPVNIDAAGVARWADRSGGIAIGYPVFSYSNKVPTKGSRNYRLTMKVSTPVLEQTSASTATGIQPAPIKAYEPLCNIEFVLPERSTLAQRKDLLAYVRNVLANTIVTTGVQDFESIY
jgi:hypothetical protein